MRSEITNSTPRTRAMPDAISAGCSARTSRTSRPARDTMRAARATRAFSAVALSPLEPVIADHTTGMDVSRLSVARSSMKK